MKLASDASALVAEALRDRGRRLISHHDLNLYVAPPTWSETVYEIGRRLDAMVRHGQIRPLRRDLAFAEATVLLSAPGGEFDGGEFLLVEQRPRMQSKGEVVPLSQGDAVVFEAEGGKVHHLPLALISRGRLEVEF